MSKLTLQSAVDVEYDKMRLPLMGFRKVDGVRAGHITGGLTGRSLDPFKNTALVAKYADLGYAGFDGELTVNGYLKNNDLPAEMCPEGEVLCGLTTGLTNRAKLRKGETDLPTNVIWNLFDYLHPDVVDLPYLKRYTTLLNYLESTENLGLGLAGVHLLPFAWIQSIAEAKAWIEDCLDKGYEGAIFRSPTAMHKSGRATATLNDFWRFKPVSDKDAIVTSVYEADENQNEATTNSLGRTERSSSQAGKVGKGTAGGFHATDVLTGKPIKVPCGAMKHKERQEVWDSRAEYAGRPFKYASLDTGVKDAPRQARWTCWRAVEDMLK